MAGMPELDCCPSLPTREETMRQLRQGDILIERLERLPDGFAAGDPTSDPAEARVVVLAAGEATGHAHRLEVPAGSRFLWRPARVTRSCSGWRCCRRRPSSPTRSTRP
jgi:hypothetical protein